MRAIITLAAVLCASPLAAASPWPEFRGPNASGVTDDARPPIHFGPGTNLVWKVPLPPGLSAPVV